MSARRAKMVSLAKPAAAQEGLASTEDELELSDLASVVWAIAHAVDAGGDSEQVWGALSSVERNLRRIAGQVGDNERRRGGAA